ncbi:BRISC and BRCA1-A complex member 1-like isoform X2 [Oculina patagonica]
MVPRLPFRDRKSTWRTVYIEQEMEDKPSEACNVEPTKDQVEPKDTSLKFVEEVRVSGDGEEEPAEGNGFTSQLKTGKRDSLSLSSEGSSENDSLRNKVPHVNCPEHIILCLDLCPEMKSMSFQCKSVPDSTIFQLVQRSIQIFVKTKSKMNANHQFSIMVLDDKASWYKHFTSDVEAICSTLNHLNPEEEISTQEQFQMCDLFEAVKENVQLPLVEDILLPPPYVVRLIIVYGRSHCTPHVSTEAKQILSTLLESPYFFLDVLYVHELPSEMNLCKEIYDYFCDMDEEEEGYMLEVSRSTTRLFDHMAALLAHPLQRPKQRDTFYKLTRREDEESIL